MYNTTLLNVAVGALLLVVCRHTMMPLYELPTGSSSGLVQFPPFVPNAVMANLRTKSK